MIAHSTLSVNNSGLIFTKFIIDLLRRKEITPRGAILLAHVDARINPYQTRAELHPLCLLENPPDSEAILSTSTLARMLVCTPETVRNQIAACVALRPKVLCARYAGGSTWQLRTRRRRGDDAALAGGYIYAPAPLVTGYEAGEITGLELLVGGVVAGFHRGRKQAYPSNAWITKQLGIKAPAASRAISKLKGRMFLRATYERTLHGIKRYLKPVAQAEVDEAWLEYDPPKATTRKAVTRPVAAPPTAPVVEKVEVDEYGDPAPDYRPPSRPLAPAESYEVDWP